MEKIIFPVPVTEKTDESASTPEDAEPPSTDALRRFRLFTTGLLAFCEAAQFEIRRVILVALSGFPHRLSAERGLVRSRGMAPPGPNHRLSNLASRNVSPAPAVYGAFGYA